MTEYEKAKVIQNLFAPALAGVGRWDEFPWHCDRKGRCQTWKHNSSQALTIDVFGFLKVAEPGLRNVVLDELARLLALPAGGNWSIDLEWVDPQNRLNEHPKHPTQVDVLASSEKARIFIECKFSEYRLSHCSQTDADRSQAQCNGNYVLQLNPLNGEQSQCALSGKGIRYWSVVPQVFKLRNDLHHLPCPFAGDLYQWMRNVVLARACCEGTDLETGYAVIYADATGLFPAQQIPALARTFRGVLRPDGVAFATVSFQQFLRHSLDALQESKYPSEVWEALIEWVDAKIRSVVGP